MKQLVRSFAMREREREKTDDQERRRHGKGREENGKRTEKRMNKEEKEKWTVRVIETKNDDAVGRDPATSSVRLQTSRDRGGKRECGR